METLWLALAGETFAPKEKLLRIEHSRPHGHLEALLTFFRKAVEKKRTQVIDSGFTVHCLETILMDLAGEAGFPALGPA